MELSLTLPVPYAGNGDVGDGRGPLILLDKQYSSKQNYFVSVVICCSKFMGREFYNLSCQLSPM